MGSPPNFSPASDPALSARRKALITDDCPSLELNPGAASNTASWHAPDPASAAHITGKCRAQMPNLWTSALEFNVISVDR